MIGRCYRWRSGACSEGLWRVVCRWRWPQKGDPLTFVHPVTSQVQLGHPGQVGLTTFGDDGQQTEWEPRPRATLKNVAVRNIETGELMIRPWYPAPRQVECSA